MLPVQPGMYIYQLATDQDKLAMRPANAALRLAMLLAEADKQGEDVLSADLKEIVVKKGDASIKVWETLFGAHTKLERQGEDYLITYSDEAQLPDGFFMAGSVLVKTNGTKVLNQSSYSAPWTVEMRISRCSLTRIPVCGRRSISMKGRLRSISTATIPI